jgi:hypothetical protein
VRDEEGDKYEQHPEVNSFIHVPCCLVFWCVVAPLAIT